MKMTTSWRRIVLWVLGFIAGIVALGYGLPLILPFLVGLAVALVAEPLTRLLGRRLPRALSSGVAISAVYGLVCLGLWFLGRTALLELSRLSEQLPGLAQGAQQTVEQAEQWLYRLAADAPPNLREQMEASITQLLSNSTQLAQDAAGKVLGAVSRMVLKLPDTLIFLVTAVTSGFLISARLPKLKPWLRQRLPEKWRVKALQVLSNLKKNLGGWLRAQAKLVAVTFGVLTVGFFVLRVDRPLLLAALLALVDALPMLGTGTVLIPWAVYALIRGEQALAIGLGALYAVVVLLRSTLEPRLIGRQLGLSPLVTLGALYAGYRLWGVLGMILAPVLVITAGELLAMAKGEKGIASS